MSRDPVNSPSGLPLETGAFSFESMMRLLASMTGIVAILVGLWLATRLFGAIAQGLQSPEAYQETFRQWTAVVGGDQLKIKQGEQELAFGPALAVAAVGMGLSLLVWLALGVMLTGAKIVSWSSGDREAVKRVLTYALGPGARRT